MVDRKDQAERSLITPAFAARKEANAPVADIPEGRIAGARLYGQSRPQYLRLPQIHRPDDETCRRAGTSRRPMVKGARQVSLEQVLQWESAGDLRPDRYPQVVKQIESDPQWQIDAVKSPRLADARACQSLAYLMPGSAISANCGWRKSSILPAITALDVDARRRSNISVLSREVVADAQ